MIKLILSDMDGTLLTPEGNLPDGFDDMIAELKKRGVMFAPASGRQYYSLMDTFDKYKENMIFLAENGTLTKHGNGDVYFTDKMDNNDVRNILRKCEEIDAQYPVLCGVKSIYIKDNWKKHLDECEKYFKRYTFVDSFDDIDDDIVKVAIADCDHWKAEERIYQPMMDTFDKDLQVVLSSALWVDIMNMGAGKGKAVTALRKQLGLKEDEVAVFGDYLNDYTMMQSAYYSYAMENAHEDLKKVANFIAPSNAEFGVVKQVYKFIEEGLI